jgi:hypothetical protein
MGAPKISIDSGLNHRLKIITGTNASAYLPKASVIKKKRFITLTPEPNVIKLIVAVNSRCF